MAIKDKDPYKLGRNFAIAMVVVLIFSFVTEIYIPESVFATNIFPNNEILNTIIFVLRILAVIPAICAAVFYNKRKKYGVIFDILADILWIVLYFNEYVAIMGALYLCDSIVVYKNICKLEK